MTTLSKQTKAQLAEIAANLGIDVSGCRIKRDFYATIKDYFQEHYDEFKPGSPYYDLAHSSRLAAAGSPKKAVVVTEEVSSEGETEQENTEEAKEYDNEDDETEEEDLKKVQESEELGESEESDNAEDTPKTKDNCALCTCSPLKSFVECEKIAQLHAFVLEKNEEAREYLSDPYSINDLIFIFESFVLLWNELQFTQIQSAVWIPATIKAQLPSPILDWSILDFSSISTTTFASTLLWVVSFLFVPKVFSYYVNFTYDFEYDSFTFALAKLFVGLIVFKTQINTTEIQRDLDFEFTNTQCSVEFLYQYTRHVILTSVIFLRNTFGNWVLIDAIFCTLISLYANLAFV